MNLQVTFYTTPEPFVTTLNSGPGPLDPIFGPTERQFDLTNFFGPTERAAREFSAHPRPRPGLNNVPLSSSPQTLHSLASYFAADNQTRRQMEKEVTIRFYFPLLFV